MTIRDKILENFINGKYAFLTERELYQRLHIHPSERKSVRKILNALERDGDLMCDRDGCYGTPEQFGAFIGRVQGNERGFAFVIPEEKENHPKDYFVPARSVNGALNKDRVLAIPVRGTEDEAKIIKVIERGRTTVVGTFEKDRRAGYVLPDDPKFDADIYIPLYLCKDAKPGDKVVAEITSYPYGRMPGGKIVEVLGESGDFFTEELSIIRSFNLREEFPYEVELAAERVSKEELVLGNRTDLRELFTITIDGEDTRDIDDAISLERCKEGFRLGVHIADVSHYVTPKDPIDQEAYARGTSVYFPDKVLPMLPRALSNGACSLNENVDRYAMSCFMVFNQEGERLSYHLCESLIHSNHRMTYHQIQDLYKQKEDTLKQFPDLVTMVNDMAELCQILERKRKRLGSVNLDVKEAHIYIDENKELQIPDYERLLSHRMIEQFMVSANEAVAEFGQKEGLPFLFRIHEQPSPEKASTFFAFLRDLGVKTFGQVDDLTPADFQEILKNAEHRADYSVINRVMLRSMQKARYSEDNLGHFGLASDCYCHFTSPIRRYPDLWVHRMLKAVLHGEKMQAIATFSPLVHTAGIDTSNCERKADEAERAVDDLYKVVYMSERMGEVFDATISGVTSFALFAELANTIEGQIRLEYLPSDQYEFIEEKMLLKGKKHKYRIGDSVKVRMENCDYANMKILFSIIE